MSSPGLVSPSGTNHSTSVSADALAAAAERRTRDLPLIPSTAQITAEHEKRQAFRRLIDPGIRRNSKEVALASLKTLLTISENLLREPENPKYQQFKPTNNIIKQRLIDPKGALEYAIALGFRPEVQNFQPYYSFNPRKMEDLRIGSAILKEALSLELEKEELAQRSKVDEKAVAKAIAEKVKLAYLDDRKTKELHDLREKELREARALAAAERAAAQVSAPIPSSMGQDMPGSGRILGLTIDETGSPPPYDNHNDNDD